MSQPLYKIFGVDVKLFRLYLNSPFSYFDRKFYRTFSYLNYVIQDAISRFEARNYLKIDLLLFIDLLLVYLVDIVDYIRSLKSIVVQEIGKPRSLKPIVV